MGCISRPSATEYPRKPSYAIAQDESTSIGEALKPEVIKYGGKSGFRLLTTGSDSLDMRLALIRAAEKTLDLQYYIIHDDTTANLLLEAILQAAARGVRVRFLIDNISFNEVRNSLSVMDGNKNIEIRVFNPTVTRDQPLPSRIIGFLTNFDQFTRRMHNKALISDNQLAILGGRNLGDEYFDAHADVTFKDTDILAAGPVTAKISRSFDNYWNSNDAFPIAALHPRTTSKHKTEKFRIALRDNWNKALKTPDGRRMLESRLSQRLKDAEIALTWADADLAVDEPEKVQEPEAAGSNNPVMRMASLVEKAEKEFVIISPYFVPRQEGVEWLSGLVARGMTVKVLTNSLASTDVVAVHTGYKRYREDIVRSGIELYELKPTGGKRPRQRLFGSTAPAHASLHTKLYVVDRKDVMIGSFNFDPRSIELNTEISLIIHSPAIAEEVRKLFEESISAKNSYRVTHTRTNDLVWVTNENGQDVRYMQDPKAGILRRAQAFLISFLPIEDQL